MRERWPNMDKTLYLLEWAKDNMIKAKKEYEFWANEYNQLNEELKEA